MSHIHTHAHMTHFLRSRFISLMFYNANTPLVLLESITYRLVHGENDREVDTARWKSGTVPAECRNTRRVYCGDVKSEAMRTRTTTNVPKSAKYYDRRRHRRRGLTGAGDERFTTARISGKRIDKPVTIAVPPQCLARWVTDKTRPAEAIGRPSNRRVVAR